MAINSCSSRSGNSSSSTYIDISPVRPRIYRAEVSTLFYRFIAAVPFATVLFGWVSNFAGLARLGERARDRNHHGSQRLLRQDWSGMVAGFPIIGGVCCVEWSRRGDSPPPWQSRPPRVGVSVNKPFSLAPPHGRGPRDHRHPLCCPRPCPCLCNVSLHVVTVLLSLFCAVHSSVLLLR